VSEERTRYRVLLEHFQLSRYWRLCAL